MAIVRAVKSGNWSDTTVWNTGALPTSADDVYSNTFTVTIDVSPTVLSISNAAATGVTAGGGFQITANGITLTGNVNAGSITCLTVSVGTGSQATVTGNCTGGSGTNSHCVTNASTGTLNITGNCTAGTGLGAHGAQNASTGTLNITGNCTAAAGAGANNNSTGVLTVVGTVQSSATQAGVIGGNAGQTTILTGPFLTNSIGINPVTAIRWFWQNTTPPATYYQIRSANLAVIRPLYTADSVGGNPATSNVRSGTVYGPSNELTGTCAVPPAGSVALGVPVDNTTGTAAITAANIRSAVGLASANLDAQLAAIPTTAAPSASSIASQVRTELATELARLDATISSRLPSSGYTAPPSAASIATAVWSAATRTLTTAIDNSSTIAAAVWSAVSRTITGGTVDTLTNAPSVPSAATIASQVRTELAPELARMANAATTQEVGDIVEGALD